MITIIPYSRQRVVWEGADLAREGLLGMVPKACVENYYDLQTKENPRS